MNALTVMDFISKHGEETASLFPLSKSEVFIQRLLDAGQILFKYNKGQLVGVCTYYRTPTEEMGKVYTHNWDLPPIYTKGPYLFVDQVVVHPKYRHQNVMNQFIKKLNYLNPPVKYGMWNDENGTWHKQDKEYTMKTNCGIVAFDKISGMLNGRSNVISLATLAQIAQDNEFLLYPMKVTQEQLAQLPTPYILHSDFHFETITDSQDLLGLPLEDSVYVLTTSPDIGEVVDVDEAKKVRGSKKAMRWIAPIGLAILGTLIAPGIGTALGGMLGGMGGFGAAAMGALGSLGAIGGGAMGAGLTAATGATLGGALGNSLTGKPNWAGAAIGGAGAGLATGLGSLLGGGAGTAASSGGSAGGQTGSALGTSTAGASATGGGFYNAGIPSYAAMTSGATSGGAGGMGAIGGSGATFGANAAGSGLSNLGSSISTGSLTTGANAPYTSSVQSSSVPSNAFSSYSTPLNSASVGQGGTMTGDVGNLLNPMSSSAGGAVAPSVSTTGGSAMPSLMPSSIAGGGGTGNAFSNALTSMGKSIAPSGMSNGVGGMAMSGLQKLGPQGIIGAGMLGYNMLRKSPEMNTTPYEDYVKQMQMMYSNGSGSPLGQAAQGELTRGIGQGVEGIFPGTDSKWYTSQLAQKQTELERAKEMLGNQYATYGRVNSPEHIKALTDLEMNMGQQMDTLKAQMSETNRSQNIGGMQNYLQLAMSGDQFAFGELAKAMGSLADAKAAVQAYQAGFQESRMGTIGNLGSTLLSNQFNPMNDYLKAMTAKMNTGGFQQDPRFPFPLAMAR